MRQVGRVSEALPLVVAGREAGACCKRVDGVGRGSCRRAEGVTLGPVALLLVLAMANGLLRLLLLVVLIMETGLLLLLLLLAVLF
jgi:hypothetical protein